MSVALWPVLENGVAHSLCDEGAVLSSVMDELDAISRAASRGSLFLAFDKHAGLDPKELMARADADDAGLPVSWHDPREALAVIDVLIDGVKRSSASWKARVKPTIVLDCLQAIRVVLAQAAADGTRFHFTYA
jgi:hypothetical protein